jgi:hypothetical protein
MRARALMAAALALAATAAAGVFAAGASATGNSGSGQSLCIGHHPQEFVWYTSSCTGHDEPELDPLSSAPGSAQNLTWTIVLPSDGATTVDSVGPTFWIGGTVTDPNSLLGQAFLELQFYPNALLKGCSANGGFNVVPAPGDYVVCSPVWEVSPKGHAESAAFNAPLLDSQSGLPMVMHAGDTVTDHQYTTAAADGMHITVTDVTTGHSGTIVLDSKVDGPLMPAYSTQALGNALGWGLVDDAPNALVWEIGHTSELAQPGAQFCLPGEATKPPCYSYDVPTWLGFHPLIVKGVTFGDGSSAKQWSAVSDYGGAAEVDQYCGSALYGTSFCWYPWYALNRTLGGFTYGGDYPGTSNDYGKAAQFQQATDCPSPFGPDTTYCSTVLK